MLVGTTERKGEGGEEESSWNAVGGDGEGSCVVERERRMLEMRCRMRKGGGDRMGLEMARTGLPGRRWEETRKRMRGSAEGEITRVVLGVMKVDKMDTRV